ncbi:MAG: futalosine hydrolase [Flavobacteriales bacterium]|nr:futalosine hydrolase [Flavobacteriales bacterium]
MPKDQRRILLVAATEKELSGLDFRSFLSVETLVAGVGMVATTFSLTRKLSAENFDLIIDIGIAGAFNSNLGVGDVVQVVTDRFSELGAEDRDRFIPADELGLIKKNELVFSSENQVFGLKKVQGITVNRVHGNAEGICRTVAQFNPDVESMEGAAVAFVCEQLGIPWVQIRAISNHVEPRNRDSWNIPLALKNLHIEVLNYLKQLDNEA